MRPRRTRPLRPGFRGLDVRGVRQPHGRRGGRSGEMPRRRRQLHDEPMLQGSRLRLLHQERNVRNVPAGVHPWVSVLRPGQRGPVELPPGWAGHALYDRRLGGGELLRGGGRLQPDEVLLDRRLHVLRDERGLGPVQGELLAGESRRSPLGGAVDVQGAGLPDAPAPDLSRAASRRQGRPLGQGRVLQERRGLQQHVVLHRQREAVLPARRQVRGLRGRVREEQHLELQGAWHEELGARLHGVPLAVLLLAAPGGHLRARAREVPVDEACRNLRVRQLPGLFGHRHHSRRQEDPQDAKGRGRSVQGRHRGKHAAVHEGVGHDLRRRHRLGPRLDDQGRPRRRPPVGPAAGEAGALHQQLRPRRQALRRELQRVARLRLPHDVRVRGDLLPGRHAAVQGARRQVHGGLAVAGVGGGLLPDPLHGSDRRGPDRGLPARRRQHVQRPAAVLEWRLQSRPSGRVPPFQGDRDLERVLRHGHPVSAPRAGPLPPCCRASVWGGGRASCCPRGAPAVRPRAAAVPA
mmetsp:Transcript_23290/g.65178  ORF Transcript_23290/g.65178 Transcript_23290/m.65178 type:complete len:520 (+) Transcript_23290:663-2222(+)